MIWKDPKQEIRQGWDCNSEKVAHPKLSSNISHPTATNLPHVPFNINNKILFIFKQNIKILR